MIININTGPMSGRQATGGRRREVEKETQERKGHREREDFWIAFGYLQVAASTAYMEQKCPFSGLDAPHQRNGDYPDWSLVRQGSSHYPLRYRHFEV